MSETKSLATKLAEIANDCSFVTKDAKNTYHKYSYASAEAVLQKVNEARTKRNVAVSTQVEYEVLSEGHVLCKLRLFFINGDDPKESPIMVEGLGEGKDSGDKAAMKALTAAHKYAYAVGLGISWGDDPEADSSVDKTNTKQSKHMKKSALKEMM